MMTRVYYLMGMPVDITELPPNSMLTPGLVTWKDFPEPESSLGLYQFQPSTWERT